MRQFVVLACVAGLSGWLTGCGPTYFLTVRPARSAGLSADGQPRSFSHYLDSVEVALDFVYYEDTDLVFQVEIINDSHRPVRVAPATFYYIPLDTSAAVASAAPTLPTRVAAFDPELRLQQLNSRLSQEAAQAEKVSWLEVLTSVSHVVEDVSSIKKKETDEQIAERDQRHQSENASFDEQREQHARQADQLYDQKQRLQYHLLRQDTLGHNQRSRGYVHFPRTDAANRLRLVVFFDERPVTFNFNQKRIKR